MTWPLILAVAVLQFALVQHSVEHGGTATEAACEFCVATPANAPPPAHHAVPTPILAGRTPIEPATITRSTEVERRAHRARAPPVVA